MDKLQQYCQEVLRFRKALNLTSISDVDVFMQRFVEPSVALAEWMPEKGRLLDIGSGMGVPGIPLLIVKPGLYGVLVERRKKRAEFLRHLVRVLGLRADVYDADVADLPSLNVDICVARAVTNVPDLLDLCSPHSHEDTLAVLPVPRDEVVKDIGHWHFQGKYMISAGEGQQVRCYHFQGIKEDVSRET